MLGSFVCKQCRTCLWRRVAPVRNPQWQPRATFLSLRNSSPPQNVEPAQPESQAQERPDEPPAESQASPKLRYLATGAQSLSQRPLGRYSRLAQDTADDENVLSSEPDGQHPEAEYSNIIVPDTRGPATAVQEALKKRRIGAAWSLFNKHYTSRDCEALTQPSLSDITLLKDGKIFFRLLEAATRAFCGRNDKSVVTPTAVLFRYEQLGIARPEYWARQTLGFLTLRLIQSANGLSPENARDLKSILLEVLSVWRLLFQCKGRNAAPLGSIRHEWNLPEIAELPEVFRSKLFQWRLPEILPEFPPNALVSFCAVYLYTLSDALKADETLRAESEPFLRIIGRLLAGSSVRDIFSPIQQIPMFNELSDDVKQEIQKEMLLAPVDALRELGSSPSSGEGEERGDAREILESFYFKRMERATKSRGSADDLEGLWQTALTDFQKDGKLEIPPRIYNGFLKGFMVLLRSARSIEIWNHMIANGNLPDQQSWIALLEGCSKARDINGFNGIWTRMLNSGIEPDNYLWTARINGLFTQGKTNEGLAALDDMSKRWVSAETAAKAPKPKGKKAPPQQANKFTKPTIEVVNGAITAIVKRPTVAMQHTKRVELIQKILGWAANFEIKPDATTFNSLIQLYLRAGDSSTAFRVLRQMEKDGIAADIATFNVLITASFSNSSFANMSQAKQTQRIISLLDSLEKEGLRLTGVIYGTAIDKLLKEHANYDAVSELIDHMGARNLVPSAHVYTSLITYYFQLDPPAILAIDSIVNKIFTSRRIPTDRYFFDRILEGYATHGEVGRMMSVLTRMSAHGRLPSWQPLMAVVEALVRDGDLHRAREVVRDVSRVEGVAKGGVAGGSQGEKQFFAMVKSFGIGVDEERIGDSWSGESGHESGEEQLQEQDFEQMSQGEGRHGFTPLPEQYTQRELEQRSDSEPVEDVHGFLQDEHEDIHSRVQRP